MDVKDRSMLVTEGSCAAEGELRGQGAVPRPAASLCSWVSHTSRGRGHERAGGARHGDHRLPADSGFTRSIAAARVSGRSLLA